MRQSSPGNRHAALGQEFQTGHATENFGTTRAHQTGDAENVTFAEFEINP